MNDIAAIVWRRLDRPGQEGAVVRRRGSEWLLRGVVVLGEEGRPAALEYAVTCDANWRTMHARVATLLGSGEQSLELARSADGEWTVNGSPRPDLLGCADVDLGFTPSTNLLPIRRLALEPGAEAEVRAAWVRFPDLSVSVLEQRYRREGTHRYRYESGGGAFTSELRVNDFGLVVDYPGIWVEERGAAADG